MSFAPPAELDDVREYEKNNQEWKIEPMTITGSLSDTSVSTVALTKVNLSLTEVLASNDEEDLSGKISDYDFSKSAASSQPSSSSNHFANDKCIDTEQGTNSLITGARRYSCSRCKHIPNTLSHIHTNALARWPYRTRIIRFGSAQR